MNGVSYPFTETLDEIEEIKENMVGPVELMILLVFQGRHVLAAHCVHLNENEIEIWQKQGGYCP